ncbi:MAG: baseplate j family protein, partial [Candidatus Frackibacter sp. T328-2]
IGSNILDSEGVIDYTNLLVNGGTSNVSIGDEDVAELGNVVVT